MNLLKYKVNRTFRSYSTRETPDWLIGRTNEYGMEYEKVSDSLPEIGFRNNDTMQQQTGK